MTTYDPTTRVLITGDTVYPGRLYVQDWPAFQASIQRLVTFAAHHKVAYVMGNHVKMSLTPGLDYPTGTTFQPDEHVLPLHVAELRALNRDLQALGKQPARQVKNAFIIEPK